MVTCSYLKRPLSLLIQKVIPFIKCEKTRSYLFVFNTSNYVYYFDRIALTSSSDGLNRIVIHISDSVTVKRLS